MLPASKNKAAQVYLKKPILFQEEIYDLTNEGRIFKRQNSKGRKKSSLVQKFQKAENSLGRNYGQKLVHVDFSIKTIIGLFECEEM